ncbi:MAG TPA: hypothetical protein PLQ89_20895 [Phycisphaerae bacterium]|nr:hypothetical protein [Phycisphaerae bacterium]HPP27175.1 hypothetical protein [Phycisphaerae bacterium]
MSHIVHVICAAFAILFAAGCAAGPNRAWLGLNTDLSRPAGVAEHRPAVSARLALLEELKVPQIRDPAMNWAIAQPAPDSPLDFSASDAVVRATGNMKADLLVVFRGVPGWASGRPDAATVTTGLPDRRYAQAFAAFVSAFVERYDGDGHHDMRHLERPVHAYQFMQEVESLPPSEYAWWLRVFREAVKAADPHAIVVLGGLQSPGLKFPDEPFGNYAAYFEHLLDDPELGGPAYPQFDVAAFHSFPGRHPGRLPFDESVAYMREVMAKHDLTLPIWLTAYGAGSAPETLDIQAENILKWTLRARSLGIQRMYLHCLCDSDDPGHGPAQNCGLVREVDDTDIFRKPAFHVFARLLRELEERPDVAFRGEGYYVLSGKGKPRYVVWKEASYEPGGTLTPGWWSVQTLTGPKTVRQGSEVRLTSSPLWVQRTTSPFID